MSRSVAYHCPRCGLYRGTYPSGYVVTFVIRCPGCHTLAPPRKESTRV